MARALYSSSPLILLDDVLSAVDAPTAKHLFEQAICGPLMQGRTKVLVTHAVSLCVPFADLIVHMKRGKPTILEHPEKGVIQDDDDDMDDDLVPHSKNDSVLKEDSTKDHKLIENEMLLQGSVKLQVYFCYLQACGGWIFVALLAFTYIAAQALIVGNDFWIKIWSDQYNIETLNVFMQQILRKPVDLLYYIGIYGLIGLLSIALVLGRILLVAAASLKASSTLHSSLITKILRAPVRFFEKTPMGIKLC